MRHSTWQGANAKGESPVCVLGSRFAKQPAEELCSPYYIAREKPCNEGDDIYTSIEECWFAWNCLKLGLEPIAGYQVHPHVVGSDEKQWWYRGCSIMSYDEAPYSGAEPDLSFSEYPDSPANPGEYETAQLCKTRPIFEN